MKCSCDPTKTECCDICTGTAKAEAAGRLLDAGELPPVLSQDEVRRFVRELHAVDIKKVGVDAFNAAVARIEDHGWKLGLSLSSFMQTRARRGKHYLLRTPKRVYHVVASFYKRGEPMCFVHYYTSECSTKREAMDRVKSCPAPGELPPEQLDLPSVEPPVRVASGA